MNDSTTVQLSVGEVRSEKFSPSILTFRNASARAATEPSDTHQPHATTTAWMRADR